MSSPDHLRTLLSTCTSLTDLTAIPKYFSHVVSERKSSNTVTAPSLTRLCLQNCTIRPDAAVRHDDIFAGLIMPKLTELTLADVRLVSAANVVAACPNLVLVRLVNASVDSWEGAAFAASRLDVAREHGREDVSLPLLLPAFPKLQRLDLRDVDSTSVSQLADAVDSSELVLLNLEQLHVSLDSMRAFWRSWEESLNHLKRVLLGLTNLQHLWLCGNERALVNRKLEFAQWLKRERPLVRVEWDCA